MCCGSKEKLHHAYFSASPSSLLRYFNIDFFYVKAQISLRLCDPAVTQYL